MQFREHQQFAYDWLQSRPRAILALDPRLGKTGVLLREIREPTVVTCPSYLKLHWAAECAKWRPDLRPQIIYPDSKPERGANVWIANYEILQDCWLPAAPRVVIDEGHYCKSHESKRSHTVMALARKAKIVRWSTGTVMPNRSMELWPCLRSLGITNLEWESFGERFAGGYQDRWGGWQFRANTRSDELRAMIEPYMLRIRQRDIGMLPNEWQMIALDLPVDERERGYSLASIEKNPNPVAFEGLAELLKFQGLAKLPLAIRYIKDLLVELQMRPILVFAWHGELIDTLAGALRQSNHVVETITGSTNQVNRARLVQRFQNNELDVLIGNIQAMGTGLALHNAEWVVFVEGRWTPGDMAQAADRAVSMDKPRSLRVDVLTVNGSIDQFMVQRCLEKQGAIDSIIQPSKEFQPWPRPTLPPSPLRLPRRPLRPLCAPPPPA